MTNTNAHELLVAANPIPDVARLESEAFPIEDVFNALEGSTIPASPPPKTPRRRGRSLAAAGTAFVVVMAISAAAVLISRGSEPRTSGGPDGALTGNSIPVAGFNPLSDLRRMLVANSNAPVFTARASGSVPTDALYFRLLTLETYNGSWFFADALQLFGLDQRPWVDEGHAWQGPTAPVIAEVTTLELRTKWLPTPATPSEVTVTDSDEPPVSVRSDDGALHLERGLTSRGMQYTLNADIPQLDLGVLVADANGVLTPVFAVAAAADEAVPAWQPGVVLRPEPPNSERYTDVASNGLQVEELTTLAQAVTERAGSDFERGLALEGWFHSPDIFVYSIDVETSIDGDDLSRWLLDADSSSYRTGYAEQFSVSMAVLARTLDIPSRVVLGFTPGDPRGDDTVVVREAHAHAWVELWIPQHGWVAFDPTPRSDGAITPTFKLVGDQLGFDLTQYLLP